MSDFPKIIIGILIFLVLVSFPVWYNLASGQAGQVPEMGKPTQDGECILPREQMREDHMHILDDWRDLAIRDGERFYTDEHGNRIERSLSNTCMHCHSNKAEFCDRCHDFMGVEPYCWTCHIEPQEDKR